LDIGLPSSLQNLQQEQWKSVEVKEQCRLTHCTVAINETLLNKISLEQRCNEARYYEIKITKKMK